MSRKNKHRIYSLLAAIFLLVSLWVRLAYFNELREAFPAFLENKSFCGLDGNAYQHTAEGVLAGTWPNDRPFYHMILYPFFLATVYSVVGVNLQIAVIVQTFLEVLAGAALYRVGKFVFDKWTGLLASLLFALYAPLIFYKPCFAQVALTIPCYVLALLFLLQGRASGKMMYFVGAGIMTGLAGLSRPTLYLLAALALGWLFLSQISRRRLQMAVVAYLLPVFLVSVPAAWHNYQTAGKFVPTSTAGWENIFLGNNPFAEGMGTLEEVLYVYLDLPGEQYKIAVRRAAKAPEAEAQAVYRREVLEFIITDPAGWFDLLGRKAYLLLWENDNRLVSPYFFHDLQTTPLLQYFPFGWRSVFIGALLGILLLKRSRRDLLILTLLIVLTLFSLLFHIQFRFRLILVPLVLLYTAAFVTGVPRLSFLRKIFVLVVLAGLFPFMSEIGWLLGLFLLALLWPLARRGAWLSLGLSLLAVWCYFVVALLLGRIISFSAQTGQPQAIFLGPQVAGPVAVGQTFTAHCDGLNRLRLVLGAFGEYKPHPVTFHLRSELESETDIVVSRLDLAQTDDRAKQDVIFPTQWDSAGRSYFFFIESPSATQAEAVTLRGAYDQPHDRYEGGSAYARQGDSWQRLTADIAFQAHCDVGLLGLINQAFEALAQDYDFGSAPLYWGLLLVHLVLLVIVLLGLKSTNLLTPKRY